MAGKAELQESNGLDPFESPESKQRATNVLSSQLTLFFLLNPRRQPKHDICNI